MTEGFADLLAPGVRVDTLMPGPYRTDIVDTWSPEQIRRSGEAVHLKRIGEPHEIVGAAMFPASDASSFTTGTIVRSDGGFR